MALADPTRRIGQTIYLHLHDDADITADALAGIGVPRLRLGAKQADIFIHSRTAALAVLKAAQLAVDWYDQKMADPC